MAYLIMYIALPPKDETVSLRGDCRHTMLAVSYALSIATNATATTMIGYRLWTVIKAQVLSRVPLCELGFETELEPCPEGAHFASGSRGPLLRIPGGPSLTKVYKS
jgi:hypothetical protein